MSGTSQSRGDYALYLDWCSASGVDVTTTTVRHLAEFAAFVVGADSTGRRRLRNVLHHLAEDGVAVHVPATPSFPLWMEGEGLASLDDTLVAIPVGGWPGGIRGSRDAVIVVAAALGGLTRLSLCHTPLYSLTVADGVAQIGSVRLQSRDDPRVCPPCVVANWLNTYGLASDFPGKAREQVMLRPARRAFHQHALTDAARLPRWASTLPTIGRRGALGVNTPIGPRTITRVIATRRRGIEEVPLPGPIRTPSMYADLSWDDVDALLDEVCANADEVLARTTAAMASGESTRRGGLHHD